MLKVLRRLVSSWVNDYFEMPGITGAWGFGFAAIAF